MLNTYIDIDGLTAPPAAHFPNHPEGSRLGEDKRDI